MSKYTYEDILNNDKPSEGQLARKEKREAMRSRKSKAEAAAKIKDPKLRKNAKSRRKALLICLAVLLVAVAFLGKTGLSVIRLTAQKKAAQAELDAVKDRRDQLEEELDQLGSDEYIEDQARSQLHMLRPGEILYIIEKALGGEDGQN